MALQQYINVVAIRPAGSPYFSILRVRVRVGPGYIAKYGLPAGRIATAIYKALAT